MFKVHDVFRNKLVFNFGGQPRATAMAYVFEGVSWTPMATHTHTKKARKPERGELKRRKERARVGEGYEKLLRAGRRMRPQCMITCVELSELKKLANT